MMRSFGWTLPAAFTLLSLAASAPAAEAAVFIPNKTADTADGTCNAADCSLREAVIAANQSSGEDVIILHSGVYRLTLAGTGEDQAATGDLDVTGDLAVVGDGGTSTVIDGAGLDRILSVASGVSLELNGVYLRNGRAQGAVQNGGAILNHGALTITRSILSGNSAASGFGGAIYTDGQAVLTIVDSTLASNVANGGGGGIAIGGTASLTNVTLTGNRSETDFGGGLYVFSDAEATFNNVTITANTAAQKGGGLFAELSAFIGVAPLFSNSILAGNFASSEPDCSGSASSGGYNVVGNASNCLSFSPAKNDKVGTTASPLDPKLGALAENGGPTPTQALLPGSPAIDAGNPAVPGTGGNACPATDQRGAPRPSTTSTPRCDSGAYEITSSCLAGGGTLCLNEGRFKVTATWRTVNASGTAQGVTLTGDTGYLWFFDPANVEVTIKVLNGCGLNNRYWVFAGGLTNVEVTLTVTDTVTGAVKTYGNPQGRNFRPVLDTSAFATCP